MNDNTAQRMADAQQAKAAMDRWLGPAFEFVEAAYMNRMTEIAATEPWEDKKLRALASAVKIAREVRAQIEQVVNDGPVAQSDNQRARQIESIPLEKRKMLGFGLGR